MSKRDQPRTLRYSRPPSLSTISSNEEATFYNQAQLRDSAVSPHLGGASHRNSIVSPLTPHGSSPATESNFDQEKPPPSYQPSYSGDCKPKPEADSMQLFRKSSKSDASTSVSPADEDNPHPRAEEIEKGVYLQTEWMWMLLQLDEIPTWHNFVTSFCSWIILAAYIVLPGTFTTLKSSEAFKANPGQPESDLDHIAQVISTGIDHLGLAVLSALLASVGALGLTIMCFVHWRNTLWLSMKIFMPVMLNSFAGLLTTLVNVYTAQKGIWSLTARVNAIVSGSSAGFASLIYTILTFYLLKKVKQDHAEKYPDELSIVETIKRERKKRELRNYFGWRQTP